MTSVKAFKLVKEKYPNAKLLFVGSGELEENVIKYAKEKHIEKDIIITGWTSEVEKYIPSFDISILPSKWEGFGLVLIEYMACDKVIVASNVGGIKNIIKDEQNGFLVDNDAEEKLATKIEILIEDEKLRNKIIENNIILRKKYDIKKVVQKHKACFNKLLKR